MVEDTASYIPSNTIYKAHLIINLFDGVQSGLIFMTNEYFIGTQLLQIFDLVGVSYHPIYVHPQTLQILDHHLVQG